MVRCIEIMAETTEIETERTIRIINQGVESLKEKERLRNPPPQGKQGKS